MSHSIFMHRLPISGKYQRKTRFDSDLFLPFRCSVDNVELHEAFIGFIVSLLSL